MIWSLRVCPARLWTNFFAQNNHRQNLIHPIIWLQHPCNRWFEASRLSSQTSIFFLHKSSTISHPSNYSSPLLRMIWSLHVCPARLYNLIFVQIFIDLIPSIPRFSYSTLFADDLKTAVCPDGLWSYFFTIHWLNSIDPIIQLQHPCYGWFEAFRLSSQTFQSLFCTK